ncbi:XrtB/PEP-CTERM-associated transcriptional regulator EpsA [Nitrosovibrio sp. Nv17]|uniref:XrtB/PEP-CTERM-associated transcriptional regulator EpsA n=1 Tax=Nitrosovibrio sp. Nv17 TaxID=1855339 RepID=UPI000908E2F2|nr:XrtB/PEP-CTERM-associated transcriptional regulator EpsA [Nitrosovibrio sp. Nv17]SFW32941.1 transcriptional regulator EpsA [Nitrosovibrio sp. Nv17]
MDKFSSLSADHLRRYARIIQSGIAVRGHFDLLRWLQGEVQHYLPHEIMLAAWGDFDSGNLHCDIVSALPGVRTDGLHLQHLLPLLRKYYNLWNGSGRSACVQNVRSGMLGSSGSPQCSLGKALRGMRSALLHGISDRRGRHDCLYVIFSSRDTLDGGTLAAMEILLPYLDTALRGVAPLPQRTYLPEGAQETEHHGLSERESEIMDWVKLGKTNAEIGSILSISAFTVKNHMQRIFKKLDVYNRMQAVSKIERSLSHG